MRDVTDLPLAVGFGISTPEQVAQVGRLADAVVVGSAFVRIVSNGGEPAALAAALESETAYLAQGLASEEHDGRRSLAGAGGLPRRSSMPSICALLALLNERTRVVEEIGQRQARVLACPSTSPSARTRCFAT